MAKKAAAAGLSGPHADADLSRLRLPGEDDRDLSRARLAMVAAVRQVVRSGLALLGVSAPERM
jgi:arginyl-tRNA synthetase